ncbi:MAG TPA: DegT/DnrJ/EryC1/StrS family aminotransferase [Candidatus Angelobacter sp.]
MMQFSIAAPMVGKAEARALARAVLQNQISRGDSIAEFENNFAAFMGGGDAVSVITGTSAIEVALRALGLAGKEVVTGAMSCLATANALLSTGCRIRFADHDRQSWQVSLDSVARAITPETRALVIAHLYGSTPDVPALADLARRHSIPLIEDCSQCLGALWDGQMVGTFGTASTFSFYGNKLITTGEGGMVWFADSSAGAQARMIRSYGQDKPFHHVVFGLNWKMPNLLAAFGVEQLKRVPRLLAARRKRMKLLRRLLGNHPEILLPQLPAQLDPSPFCFPLLVPNRDSVAIQEQLARAGIETRPLFAPQFDQPCWHDVAEMPPEEFPVARYLGTHGFYLPVSPHLKLSDFPIIAKELLRAVEAPAAESVEVSACA